MYQFLHSYFIVQGMNGVAKNIIVGAIITAGVAGLVAALSNKNTREKIARGIKKGIDEVQRRAKTTNADLKEEIRDSYERTKERSEEKLRERDR